MDRNYKNTFCGILILAILLMAVGYSILSTRLNVEGTSKITSDFNIEVIGISEFYKEGLAETTNMDFTPTSATYSANIQAPGDGMIYEIIIENKGTLSGYVYFDNSDIMYGYNDYGLNYDESGMYIGVVYSSKTQADKNNPSFKDEIDNRTELFPDEKLYVYAYIYFYEGATSLPEQKTFTSTVDFNFYSTNEHFPVILPSLNDALLANNDIVTSGDGLMINDEGDYVFVSDGVDDDIKNYISLNGVLMRIVSFDDRMENSCAHDWYSLIEVNDPTKSGVAYSTTADDNGFYNSITPTLFNYMRENDDLYNIANIDDVGWSTYSKDIYYIENNSFFGPESYVYSSATIFGINELMASSTNTSCTFANLSNGGCKSWLTDTGDTYLFNPVYESDKTTNTGKIAYLEDGKVITVDPRDVNTSNRIPYGSLMLPYGVALRYTNEDTADGSRENPYIIDPDSINDYIEGLIC